MALPTIHLWMKLIQRIQKNYYGYTKLAIEGFLRWYDKLRGMNMLRFVTLMRPGMMWLAG
jgi:nucleoside-diphosphate-sugar epimerase